MEISEIREREMTAIGMSEPGGPDVLKPVRMAVPRPGRGEVLVKVAAAGVNRPDVLQRQGNYPVPPGAPDTPGLEVSGRIVAVGDDVPPEMAGQRVCALLPGGGYAEYAVASMGCCLPVPDDYDMAEAAALPETLFTVWTNLFERAYVVAGETVLVHGGTSGIGTMAVRLCNLFDIRVIVTCGSEEKCEAALQWGADHAINYKTEDFAGRVMDITHGQGCNAVLDMVGGSYVRRNLSCLGMEGRHVSIAMLGGAKGEVVIPEIMRKRLMLTGSLLRPRSVAFKSVVADEIAANVWPFVEEGRLRPAMDRTFPLDQAARAHERMESGEHFGKIVLTVGD